MLNDGGNHILHVVDRDGKAQALHRSLGVGAAGQLGGDDADHLAVLVEQGAAGVAGVDGGVGLEHVHYRSIAHGDGAVLGGDIAPGEGKGQLAQGVADGVHVLAHVELVGIAQGDRLEVAHVDFQHGDVVLLFTAHQGGVIALAVGEKHLDVADAVDDVIIGEDVAGAAVAADDEAGAGYGVLHRIAEHIGIHIAVDAHRRAQVGGVDLLGGEDGLPVHMGQGYDAVGGGTLVNSGLSSAQMAGGQYAAAAHQAAHQGTAKAQGHKPGRPALFPGGLGGLSVPDVKMLGLYGLPLLRGSVIVTVIHNWSLL